MSLVAWLLLVVALMQVLLTVSVFRRRHKCDVDACAEVADLRRELDIARKRTARLERALRGVVQYAPAHVREQYGVSDEKTTRPSFL